MVIDVKNDKHEKPKMCKLAIFSICFIVLSFFGQLALNECIEISVWCNHCISLSVIFLVFIFGTISIKKINKSNGRLIGLGLAVVSIVLATLLLLGQIIGIIRAGSFFEEF